MVINDIVTLAEAERIARDLRKGWKKVGISSQSNQDGSWKPGFTVTAKGPREK